MIAKYTERHINVIQYSKLALQWTPANCFWTSQGIRHFVQESNVPNPTPRKIQPWCAVNASNKYVQLKVTDSVYTTCCHQQKNHIMRRICYKCKQKLEATRALKPQPKMVQPPGEHNRVSVYALFPNGKESWII